MPRWSTIFIRTSLLYLILGSLTGGLILVGKGGLLSPTLLQYLTAHVEMVLIGWVIHFVIGTAYWMLPRYSSEPVRGRIALVAGCYLLLNLGVIGVVIASLLPEGALLGLGGRIAQFAGIGLFAIHAWPRIRPFSDAV